jgi:CDP-diglyceride synthetase
MDKLNEKPSAENVSQQTSNKKDIWGAIGLVLSFYIVAIIIGAVVSEENYQTQFVLMILPAIATIGYGYWAAMKENYAVLKVIFIMLLTLVALEWASRILLRI